jgi:hypothetical protein
MFANWTALKHGIIPSVMWCRLALCYSLRDSLGAGSVTIDDIDACRLHECAMGVQLTSNTTADTKAAAVVW